MGYSLNTKEGKNTPDYVIKVCLMPVYCYIRGTFSDFLKSGSKLTQKATVQIFQQWLVICLHPPSLNLQDVNSRRKIMVTWFTYKINWQWILEFWTTNFGEMMTYNEYKCRTVW